MFLNSVSRERALEFRDYVIAREPHRLAMLLQVLEFSGGPVEEFDGTLASLRPVWRWYIDFVDRGWPEVPEGILPATSMGLTGKFLAPEEEALRRRIVGHEMLAHYLKLVLHARDTSAFWDVYLQQGRALDGLHQETGVRLAGGEFVDLLLFVPNITGQAIRGEQTWSRDPDRLRNVLLMRCPAGWADVDQPRGRPVLEEYRQFVGVELPEHVAENPFARWAAEDAAVADGPSHAGGAEAFGAELTLAVGPAAGLEEPSAFATLPVAVVAEVLRSLDLTHEDGAPLRDEELMQDGLQLFDVDGTAMVETVVADGALRALHVEPAGGGTAQRWDVIEGRLQALADRVGGHLVAVGPHDWPEV